MTKISHACDSLYMPSNKMTCKASVCRCSGGGELSGLKSWNPSSPTYILSLGSHVHHASRSISGRQHLAAVAHYNQARQRDTFASTERCAGCVHAYVLRAALFWSDGCAQKGPHLHSFEPRRDYARYKQNASVCVAHHTWIPFIFKSLSHQKISLGRCAWNKNLRMAEGRILPGPPASPFEF